MDLRLAPNRPSVSRVGIAALVAALACALTAPVPATAATRADLDAQLDAIVASGATAVTASVSGPSVNYLGARGTADFSTDRAARATDRARIGSITKPMVATLVLSLHEDGLLDLDAPVSRYLPGVLPRRWSPTVRQLLSHRSGIPDYDTKLFADPQNLVRLRTTAIAPTALVRTALQGDPPQVAPGGKFDYSNTDYVLAGMIVERVTGNDFEDELRRRVFVPAGMTSTYTPKVAAFLQGSYLRGYLAALGQRFDYTIYTPTLYGAAGAVVSTARDTDRFWLALRAGKLVSPRLVREMLPPATGPRIYGLGVLRIKLPCGVAYGHDGSVFGYDSLALTSADGRRSTTILLTGRDRSKQDASIEAARFARIALCPGASG